MSEQQRVFLAVFLCVGILLLWQFMVPQKPPAPPRVSQSTTSDSATAGTSEATGAGSGGVGEATDERVPSGAADEVVAEAPVVRLPFSTDLLRGEISNEGWALGTLDLLKYDERQTEDEERRPVSLVLTEANAGVGQASLLWKVSGRAIGRLAKDEADRGVAFAGEARAGVTASVVVVPREDAYALDYQLRIENESGAPVPVDLGVRLSLKQGDSDGGFLAPPRDQLSGVCGLGDRTERKMLADLEDGPWVSPETVYWAGVDRQYFVVAVVPKEGGEATRCEISGENSVVRVDTVFSTATVGAGQTWERGFTLFVGPKLDDRLAEVSERLPAVVDYNIWGIPLGALARPMVFLMNMFHGWTGSWGLAIMLLTLVVKVLLFPVTYKSVVSMRKMQLLKPELDRIKKQFENDRERQQMEQLKLFREKGVNPLGGCLPMLLQMPVWFALYRTLWTAVDLYQQPFLWLDDLTAKEPFPFLALALGALTFLQQKITPMAADNQQAKMMMYIMPVMLTVFMIALPSGLVLYILVNSVLTIVQQLAINRRQIAL